MASFDVHFPADSLASMRLKVGSHIWYHTGFTGAPAPQQGGMGTNRRFPCLLAPWVVSLFLVWGGGWACAHGQAGGMTQVLCAPLWWCCVQRVHLVPRFCFQQSVFTPGSSEAAAEFLLSVSFAQVPQPANMCSNFQSHIVSLCILLFEEHVPRFRHYGQGSQVLARLKSVL